MYEPTWKPASNMPELDIAAAVTGTANNIVVEQIPDLADMFPFRNSSETRLGFGEGWFGLVVTFANGPGVPSAGPLTPAEVIRFNDLATQGPAILPYDQLSRLLGSEYYSERRFSYLGPARDGALSWHHLSEHLLDWLNHVSLPSVLRLNEQRVLRAIPQPPQINYGAIGESLWILECEETCRQGTAFLLGGIGMVTCEHVLGTTTVAFRTDQLNDRRAVEVVARNAALDLAIIRVAGEIQPGLPIGAADGLRQMDHLVICGYPNYRLGDSGTIVPGLVTGFRPVSGVRRILTNAPIIAGSSGGPVLGADGNVIGVAATGADRMEDAGDTEHHSVIPIDVLQYLLR